MQRSDLNILAEAYSMLSEISLNNSSNNVSNIKVSPKGNFNCSNQNINSLEGSPKTIEGSFYCQQNSLDDLVGGPMMVGEHYDCSGNDLKRLTGLPKYIGGNLIISKQIESRFPESAIHNICKIGGNIFYVSEAMY